MTTADRQALEFAAEHLSSDWPERCQEIVRRARAALATEAVWKASVAQAYATLWRANDEPGTPNRYASEQAANRARVILRDMLTLEERAAAINAELAKNEGERR